MDVYSISAESVAHQQLIGVTILAVTSLTAALLVIRFGRSAWWAVLLAALAFPNIIVFLAGGARGDAAIANYLGDVALHLAAMGLVVAALGALVGYAVRRALHRGRS